MKIEKIILREWTKCKKDPVYFAQKYMLMQEPWLDNTAPLTNKEKSFLRTVNPQNVTDKGKLQDIIFRIQNSTVANVGEVIKQIIKEENL
jgi:hypothetical protein